MSLLRSLTGVVALAGITYLAAACADGGPTQPTRTLSPATMTADMAMGHMGGTTGTTAGWEDGKTVTLFYSKPFFCQQPPSSGATSSCELGADAQVAPRSGPIPTLYVVVPLFPGVDASTLQCPEAGNCVDHPSTIDLSRVFGAGTENAPLPPHSHVLGDEPGASQANGGWWDVEVVGVTSPTAWNAIVAGKSLATVRTLQHAENGGVTGDIPTNLYLFFNVRP